MQPRNGEHDQLKKTAMWSDQDQIGTVDETMSR